MKKLKMVKGTEWIPHFKMQAMKVDKSNIKTYSEAELKLLLKKTNIKKCSFADHNSLLTQLCRGG